MKKLLLMTLISLSISACGVYEKSEVSSLSDDNQQLKTQIEEYFKLPPEPDSKINNSTILGVDLNNNDIRDDWERAIAFEFYQDPAKMYLYNKFATSMTRLSKAYDQNDINSYKFANRELKYAIECGSFLYGKDAFSNREIFTMYKDNYRRKSYIQKRDFAMKSYLDPKELMPLSGEELKNICPKFKK